MLNLDALLRRFTGPEPESDSPDEVLLEDLGLRILNVGADRVRVLSDWAGQGLFRVQGQLAGKPTRGEEVTVPLQGRASLTISVAPRAPEGARPQLVRSNRSLVPPDAQLLEFLFVHQGDEVRLTFRLSDQLLVDDFEPMRDTRPLFRTLPPVEEMAVVLANVARAQTTTSSLLADLAEQAGSPATRELASMLTAAYPPLADLASPAVRQLHEHLGGPLSLPDLTARALFAELELGRLTPEAFQQAAHHGQPPPVGEETLSLLCQLLTSKGAEAARPRSESDGVGEAAAPPDAPALGELEHTLRQPPPRRFRHLLAEAGRLTSSHRTELVTANPHPSALELHRFLGDRVEPALVAALVAFVDLEAGLKGPSLYALAAVAHAFGVPLRGMQCPATELAPTGVLAEYLDAGSRVVRWVQDTEGLRREGLDFTGHVLALFGEASPQWTPLTQEQMLGGTGSLSRPAETLERLYAALKSVLHEPPEYQPVSPESWKEAVRQLKTGYFKGLLSDVVPPDRLTPLLADLAGRAPEDLEILPSLEALGDADPMYLALELLAPSLEGEGLAGLLYQRMRRDRLAELLRGKSLRARRAAVSMLSTAGFDGELAHELRRLRTAPEAELAAAADVALARVALGGAVPFPPAVRLAQSAAPAEPSTQLDELWPKLGELAPASRREALAQAAATVSPQDVAQLLNGLNRAFREEGDKAVVLVSLLTQKELTQRRIGSFQKWKFFAFSRQRKLAALLLETPSARVWDDYLAFQKDSLASLADSPTRLGSGQPVELYRLKRPVGPWEREGELSAFFMDLVTKAARTPLDELRVCRVRANLPPIESFFFWDVAIDPRLVDVYEPATGRFTPQLHHLCLRPAEVGYEDDDWQDFEALVTLFTESRPAFRQLPRLAREVAQTFELPPHYSRQVLKMLVDLGAGSAYDF